MKKVFFTLFAFIGVLSMAIAQTPVVSGPAIAVNEDIHDFGTIDYDSPGTCEFIVTNTGTEPLIISECTRSCGCTTPKCDSTPIAPGATSTIKVQYDTKRVGPFSKSVSVMSNATNEPVKVLMIKGTVGPNPNEAPAGGPVKPAEGAPVEKK